MAFMQNKFITKQFVILIGNLAYSFGIGLFAYLGIFNRYYADDWCYSADFLERGFLGTLRGYNYITTYASNRFSLTLFSGIFELLGILGVRLITPVIVSLFLFSAYKLFSNLRKIWAKEISNLIVFFLSGVIVYFTIYLAPHLYQSFYWRAGILPYTAPLVLTAFVFSLITDQTLSEKLSPPRLVAIALLSFIAGGFSEAGNAFITTGLLICLSLAVFFRKSSSWARKTLLPASLALIFALLAMALLVASPTSHMRMGRYGQPAAFNEFFLFTINYSFEFIRSSFVSFPIPHFVIMFTTFSLSVIANFNDTRIFKKRHLFGVILVVLIIGFLLIAASYAPSAFIEKVPPAVRARIIARFSLVTAIALLFWLIGILTLQFRLWVKQLTWIALGILILSFAYTIRAIGITFETKYPLYLQRADIWDARDKLIMEKKNEGMYVIDVRGIDSLPVGGLRDLKENPNFWINGCAARYYGVEAIQATLP